MTRPEMTGIRSLDVSAWLRANLPGSDELVISDVDFVLRNRKTKQVGIVEVKSNLNRITYAQYRMYCDLDRIFAAGCKTIGWHWAGIGVLSHAGSAFPSSLMYWYPYQLDDPTAWRANIHNREGYQIDEDGLRRALALQSHQEANQ